jgi:hypothetical protein
MSPPYLVLYKITYLGTRLTSKNEELREVQSRIQGLFLYLATDKKSWRQLESSSSTVPNTDPQYSLLIYGSEVWTLFQGDANKIDSFERKTLRKIFGPTQSKGAWRIMYSDEIYKIYSGVYLSTYTFKETNVGWARCKNGRTSYPKEGTRKMFCRRKANGESTK